MATNFLIQLVLYGWDGYRIGPLPDTIGVDLTVKHCDVSTLKLTYPTNGIRSEYLSAILASHNMVELAVEVSHDGGNNWKEPPIGRFIVTSSELDLLDPAKETITVTVTSNAERLADAVVMPPYVDPSTLDEESSTSDVKRTFENITPGALVYELWGEAKERGWGYDLGALSSNRKFYDSAGKDWSSSITTTVQGGNTLRSVIDDLVDKGVMEWRMEGRNLVLGNVDESAYLPADSGKLNPTHKEIVLRLGDGATTATESYAWGDRCSTVIVEGEKGLTWTFENPYLKFFHSDVDPWNMRFREKYVKASKVTTEEAARIAAAPYMRSGAARADTIKRSFYINDLNICPLYNDGFQVGSWINVERKGTKGGGYLIETMRLLELTVSWEMGSPAEVDITLGDRESSIIEKMTRLATDTENGVAVSGTGGSPTSTTDPNAVKVVAPPAPPTNVTLTPYLTAGVTTDDTYVNVSWTEITEDTLGKTWDYGGTMEYEVRYRRCDSDGSSSWNWEVASVVDEPSLAIRSIVQGTYYVAQVRGKFNHAHSEKLMTSISEWSENSNILYVPTDTDAPPVPSTPSVTMAFQALEIVWDGLDVTGESGRPADFSHLGCSVRLEGKAPIEEYTTASPNQLSLAVAGLTPGDYEVRIRSWDVAGNVSDWSDGALVDVSATVDADSIQEAVDAALAPYDDTIGKAVEQANAMGVLMNETVKYGYTPPSEGSVGLTYWQGPDGKWWQLKTVPEGAVPTE